MEGDSNSPNLSTAALNAGTEVGTRGLALRSGWLIAVAVATPCAFPGNHGPGTCKRHLQQRKKT